MTLADVLLIIVYFFFLILLGAVLVSFGGRFALYKKYFYSGLAAKLIGGFGYAMIYTFYYTYGGDTITYFKDGLNFNHLMITDFVNYAKFAYGDLPESAIRHNVSVTGFHYHKGTAEFFMTRFSSIFIFFGLGNFFATTMVFAFSSFIGVWHMFLVFVRRYPEIERKMAFAVLFIPSVFFWGSGLMKDAVTIGFVGLLLFYLDRIKRGEGYTIINFAVVIISAYIVFNIKAYILISFLPASIIWFFLEYRSKIGNPLIRAISLPLFLTLSIGGAIGSIIQLGKYNEAYAVESFFVKARGIQTWHYKEGENTSAQHGRGSSYSLGEYEETYAGLVTVFPAAVNVALFRPYLSEVKNPMMAFSALESLIMLLATIYIFLGLGFFRVIKFLSGDSFLLMSFIFAMFFAFAVGFTSYNFGALVRYKIPCIPFYVASLFILEYESKQWKKRKWSIRRTSSAK